VGAVHGQSRLCRAATQFQGLQRLWLEILDGAGLHQWGLKMQDDITDGVKKLIADGIADPKRICIVGASYGGYAALAGATFTPNLYACAVSFAGVSDLPGMLLNERTRNGKDSDVIRHSGNRASATALTTAVQLDATSPARSRGPGQMSYSACCMAMAIRRYAICPKRRRRRPRSKLPENRSASCAWKATTTIYGLPPRAFRC
jgi:poly(3-hydroxybutyrate) depolymerase